MLVDADSGRPIADNHVLMFYGRSGEDIRAHKNHAEAKSDNTGLAVLSLDAPDSRFIQLWVDGYKTCIEHPNYDSIDLTDLVTTGITRNLCNSRGLPVVLGLLTIAIHKESISERMKH